MWHRTATTDWNDMRLEAETNSDPGLHGQSCVYMYISLCLRLEEGIGLTEDGNKMSTFALHIT